MDPIGSRSRGPRLAEGIHCGLLKVRRQKALAIDAELKGHDDDRQCRLSSSGPLSQRP